MERLRENEKQGRILNGTGFRLAAIIILSAWTFFVQGQDTYRTVFYNVENLFDTKDDPATRDEDFTPYGKLHWNQQRYTNKLLKLAQTLKAVGEGKFPAFIGLCEVENETVLSDLIQKTELAEGNYMFVHRDSPDPRGIDVAFLYRPDIFRLLEKDFLTVEFPEDKTLHTRDILYIAGILKGKRNSGTDTLHFFICHFPSMSGGEAESEWKRKRAAATVKNKINALQRDCPAAAVIIMGDFNGKADRPAQTEILGSRRFKQGKTVGTHLYNTGYYLLNRGYGSYKYKGNWQTIDHIIVSGNLLDGKGTLQADPELRIFAPRFLLEEDKTHYGFKPFRTYIGPRYNGGYSDHLPVYLDLNSR